MLILESMISSLNSSYHESFTNIGKIIEYQNVRYIRRHVQGIELLSDELSVITYVAIIKTFLWRLCVLVTETSLQCSIRGLNLNIYFVTESPSDLICCSIVWKSKEIQYSLIDIRLSLAKIEPVISSPINR